MLSTPTEVIELLDNPKHEKAARHLALSSLDTDEIVKWYQKAVNDGDFLSSAVYNRALDIRREKEEYKNG